MKDVGQLNRALVRFGRADGATEIQRELCALLERIEAALGEIWREESESPGGGGEDGGVRFGPEATTADIVENRERGREYRPPYRLLGERDVDLYL